MLARLVYSRTATASRSFLLATDIFLSTLFSETLSLCSSLNTHTMWRMFRDFDVEYIYGFVMLGGL